MVPHSRRHSKHSCLILQKQGGSLQGKEGPQAGLYESLEQRGEDAR